MLKGLKNKNKAGKGVLSAGVESKPGETLYKKPGKSSVRK